MSYKRYNLQHISAALQKFRPKKISAPDKKAASVAMILAETDGKTEVLFIERAANEKDPWSGHIAFPGGKIEAGEDSKDAAIRETLEEINLNLSCAKEVGRLSDIVGANLPVLVSCHIFVSEKIERFEINNEVKDIFWLPLETLYNPLNSKRTAVSFDGRKFYMPAVILPFPEKPPLWGITYRLIMQLKEILQP